MPETTRASTPTALRGDAATVHGLLQLPDVLLHGHFELLSGVHTDRFFAFSEIARDSSALDAIARWLAPEARALELDAVLAPTTAGVGLGWTLASVLGVPLHLASVDDGGRPSRILGGPGLAGQRVLLVNDVVTTGGGLAAMAQLAHASGASTAGAGWFLSRSAVDVASLLGVPCLPVAEWYLPAWHADECPACGGGDEPAFAYDLN